MDSYDVIVVGAGNAACAAAESARQQGAKRVVVLEKSQEDLRGGNTHYSGGLLRVAFERTEDLLQLIPDVEKQAPGFLKGVTAYTKGDYWNDLQRVTEGRIAEDLAEILISQSFGAVKWMKDSGIELEAAVALSAIKVAGELKWPTGAVVRAIAMGIGLSRMWFETLDRNGVEVRYGTRGVQLLQEDSGRVTGVRTKGPRGFENLSAHALVLGCGGFEANPEWRARYLGPPWDHAKVRGTPFNTGDGLQMALDVGALPFGQWTGCHSTPISLEAPPYGDRKLTDQTNRLSYPFGILVNKRGERFCNEGEDFQWYTYAKMGRIILNEPGGYAYQIFDSKVAGFLEPRYKTSRPVRADSLENLVAQLDVDHEVCMKTIAAYNSASRTGSFDPVKLDGLTTQGLAIEKSNWAQPLDTAPYLAYPVTGGITFTFGGLRINERAQVIDVANNVIPGLYCCGEMVGGLFHSNYPGGTGLVSGAVFGRIAGGEAATR